MRRLADSLHALALMVRGTAAVAVYAAAVAVDVAWDRAPVLRRWKRRGP